MEISWLLSALLSAIAAAIISNIIKNRRRPELRLPPGPKPWPVIGNLNLLGSVPNQSLHLLAQKYGEIMLLKFGKFPVVIASSPEMARQFLKVHDAVFASRPAFAAYKHISYDYSDVSFSPYGPYWREARKLFITKVLCSKKVDSFEHIRVEERRSFLARVRSASTKPVRLRDHLSRFTLSIICRMTFRDDYLAEPEGEKMDELLEMVEEWFLLNGVFNVGDWIPWLNPLDLQGYMKKMKALRLKMDRFSDFVIDDHLAKRAADKHDDVNKDFVDVLLQISEEEPNPQLKFTRDCVKALIMNLLVAATDTSAIAIEWAIHEILKHPGTIEKAKEELNRVIGRERWVEENDFSSSHLPYLDALIKETFRLHPIATLLGPHFAMENCDVSGYNISKGTVVIVNTWSIGRNPKYWDRAEEFLPERFVGKEIEMAGSDFTLAPFSAGRRKCPGYNLALKIVRTTLANLLHGFELRLDEGMRPQDVSMEESYGLTTSPKYPISIIMKPTLPDHFY